MRVEVEAWEVQLLESPALVQGIESLEITPLEVTALAPCPTEELAE